ncbi:MAG: hypothetical protein ACRDM0_07025 [Thermoleophilaceae bacterium]
MTDAEKRAVDEFWKANAERLAAAANELSWPGGLARRQALADAAERGRRTQGFLTKETFDEILRWGFGRASNLPEAEIRAGTKEAFDRLAQGDEAGALRRLRGLSGVGVSRASKILALSDQKNLGVYDSHAAAAVESITDGGKPLIAVPPGRSQGLRDRPPVSQERLNRDYPKFTATLRRLLENAKQDERYAAIFKGASDIEQALFSSHRQEGAAAPEPSGGPGVGGAVRESVNAGIAGAAVGAVGDLAELRRGNLSWRDAARRRLRDGLRGGAAGAATSVAKQFGKATDGPRAHVQGGARAALVGVVVGGANELPAVVRGELHPRDFAENRLLDAGEAGIGRLAGGGVVILFAAAPFEAPVVVVGGSVLVVGAGVSRAVRPVRHGVARRQEKRRRRRLDIPDDAA